MTRLIKILTIIGLSAILAGCTTYRHAVLPGQEPQPMDDGKAHVVGPRADVRITLDSGESVKGVAPNYFVPTSNNKSCDTSPSISISP